MPRTRRVEILFDPGDYEVVQRVARERGETVGEVIREAVAHYYVEPALERRRAAARRLLALPPVDITWEEAKEAIGRGKVQGLEAP